MLSKIDVKCSLQKIIFHFSVEEMRNKENPAKPQNSNDKFTNQFENHFNFFGMVRPEPIFKPMFESVREGRTTTVITVHVHVNNPFAFS